MSIDTARALLAGHQPHRVQRAVELLLDEIQRQQSEIDELRQVALGHERRIVDCNRNISRIQGIHGA